MLAGCSEICGGSTGGLVSAYLPQTCEGDYVPHLRDFSTSFDFHNNRIVAFGGMDDNDRMTSEVLILTPEESVPGPLLPENDGHSLCSVQRLNLYYSDDTVTRARRALQEYYPRLKVDLSNPPSPRVGHTMTVINLGIPKHSETGRRSDATPPLVGALVIG